MAIDDDFLYEVNDRGERVMVKSLESRQRAYLRFTNRSSRPVDIWWRDFEGKKRHYVRLAAGAHYDINTFLTHPWEFTDASTNERFMINNQSIFRAPTHIGGMLYRTNWNINAAVRTLRRSTMLALATFLPNAEAAMHLDLPQVLVSELRDLTSVIKSPPGTPPVEEHG